MIDFKDFIRLSEFLDNTIFKVTSDSSPARSTTTVGVVVEPSILERGKGAEIVSGVKFTHFAPKRILVKPTVRHNEAKYYSQLDGDKMPYFTGRMPGYNVTYYDDFQALNENKYAANRSFTADDTYAFNHSKYKALLNNVSNQKQSSEYVKVEYLKPITSSTSSIFTRGINTFITSAYSFQDSYTNMTSYTRPRYEGTKNVDANYLLPYSVSGSVTSVTNKVGVFNNFKKDSFLPNKTVLELKYLSDKDGNLTVLNSSNKNLGDLQKIFRPNDKLTIGFFRNSQNKNDKRYIYETGYSYRPVFYFASSVESPSLNDSELNFEYLNGYNPNDASATNGNVIIKIASGKTATGTAYPDYQADFTTGVTLPIYGVFDYHGLVGEANANGKYTNSSYSSLQNSKFVASSTTSYVVNANFNIEPVFSSGGSVKYSVVIIKNGSVDKTIEQTAQNKAEIDFWNFSIPEGDILTRLNDFLIGYTTDPNATYTQGDWVRDTTKYYTKINVSNVIDRLDARPATRGSFVTTLQNNGISDSFKVVTDVKEFRYDNNSGIESYVEVVRQSIYTANGSTPLYISYYRKAQRPYPPYSTGLQNTHLADYTVAGVDDTGSNLQITIPMVVNYSVNLNATDTLEFRLLRLISTGTMLYERIQSGDFSIKGSSVVSSIGITIDNPNTNNPTISLSPGLSFVYGSTRYIPFSNPANNNSKAWSTFGAISEDFVINKNSFVLFIYTPKGKNGIEKRLIRIKNIDYSTTKGQWILSTDSIPGDLATEIIANRTDYQVCFLSRFLDETSVILNYTFTDNEFGATTNNAGFIVPRNLNPAIQSNLDAVVATIKNKTNLVTN